jgi:hypothetical protein
MMGALPSAEAQEQPMDKKAKNPKKLKSAKPKPAKTA